MFGRDEAGAICRTVLEQQIRARQQTFEEFAEFAEKFGRENNEPGTLSVRHLQRLVAGRRKDGSALGRVRPATARLLERIFSMSIGELLSEPTAIPTRLPAHPLRVAIAVVVRGPDVLVVRRRGDVADGNSWQFPAGMVKPGMTSEIVAVRETLGETDVHCVVRDSLGSRLHPVTNVLCEYLLCDYVAGEARNADVFENVDVAWIDKTKLAGLIPSGQIYRPVLQALELSSV
jgi:8-oxo-dGTP pyrophosphatase MutT (NUDIX family)